MEKNTVSQGQSSDTLILWSFRWKYQVRLAEKRVKALLQEWQIDGKVWFYKISEFSLNQKFHLVCGIEGREILDEELYTALSRASAGHELVKNKRVLRHLAKNFTETLQKIKKERKQLQKERYELETERESTRRKYSADMFGHSNAPWEEIKARIQVN